MRLEIWKEGRSEREYIVLMDGDTPVLADGPKSRLDVAFCIAQFDKTGEHPHFEDEDAAKILAAALERRRVSFWASWRETKHE